MNMSKAYRLLEAQQKHVGDIHATGSNPWEASIYKRAVEILNLLKATVYKMETHLLAQEPDEVLRAYEQFQRDADLA